MKPTPVRFPGPPGRPTRRPGARSRGVSLRGLVMALGGLLAVNLLVAAFFLVGRGDDGAPPLPAEIERVTPARSAVVRAFEDLGADLADDHTGVLLLDGTELPDDQLKRVTELGQVTFRPGPGQDPEKLSPGFHTVTVLYWRQDAAREQAKSYTWSFQVG